jgi:hypothetical protein
MRKEKETGAVVTVVMSVVAGTVVAAIYRPAEG